MAVEVERLLVTLEARIGQYQTDLATALTVTNRNLGAMEAKYAQLAVSARIAGGGLGPLAAGMSNVGKAALLNNIATERLIAGMSGVGRGAAAAGRSAAMLSSELKNTASAGLGLGAVFGTIGTYLVAERVTEYANAYTRVNRALQASPQIFGIALKSQQELTDLANEARIDVEAYAKTYIRTEAAIRDYGFEAGTGAKVTSTLAKALKLGAASASEQASTILQFSQALQKGKLDGDEFRTVMENAGVVQELLAKRIGVSKGEIIKMAAAGKLTVRELVAALVDGGDSIDRIFRQMPTTVDEAFTVLRNNVITYVGHLNEATGATDGLVNVTVILAKNIETVGDVALVTAAALLSMFTPAIIRNAGLLTVAMLAAAGPIGLVIGALGGAAAAVALFGDEIKVTEDKTVSLIDRLKALAATIASRPQLSRGLAVVMRGDQKAREDLAYGGAKKDPNRLDPTNERDQALLRSFEAGTSVEFGDGQTRKGDPGSSSDANAKRSAYERETADIIKRTNALMAQAATIGESTLKTEKAKAARDLLTAAEETAKRTGIAITPAQLADIDQASTKYAEIAAQTEYLNALNGSKEATRALQDELQLVGLYGFELDKARSEQDLLNAARKAGIDLNPAERERISILAEQNARAKEMQRIIGDIRAEGQDALKGFISDIRDGASATEALGNSLNKLADKLIDMAVNGLVEAALGPLFGGGSGGILSGLISGAPATTSGWATSVFPAFAKGGVMVPGQGPRNLPRFAAGGVSRSAAIFGEAGPEAAVPLPDGRRIPVDLRMPTANVAAASQAPTVVTVAPVFQVSNGTPDGIEKMKREVVPLIQQTVKDLFDRNPRFARSGI